MRKNHLTTILFAFSSCLLADLSLQAQGNVGIGTDQPNPSALLDLHSGKAGLLVPRMKTNERIAITSPANSLLVYDIDMQQFMYFDAATSSWKALSTVTSPFEIRDMDNDTRVTTEKTPDDDRIRFDMAGTEHIVLYRNPTGNVLWGINNSGKNIFIGDRAGEFSVNTGTQHRNVGIGSDVLYLNGTNQASGVEASANTAIGTEAMRDNTQGYYNTGAGYRALMGNTIGAFNAAFGAEALYANNTGIYNTAIGALSLQVDKGTGNTAVGMASLQSLTDGWYCTSLGIGSGASDPMASNATAIGAVSTATSNNSVVVGNNSVTLIGGAVPWSTISDGRFKRDVAEDVPGLDFIARLRPVTYTLDVKAVNSHIRSPLDSAFNALEKNALAASALRRSGFIAQEVETAANAVHYDFSGLTKPKGDKDHYALAYSDFIPALVKAVQEQQAQIARLEQQILEQRERINSMTAGQTPVPVKK